MPMQAPLKPVQTINQLIMGGSGLEGVEVLTGLGLTVRQARVYLALLKAGDTKAKVIAEFAQVERQEVYRLIETLKLAGLVEQNLTVPTSYTATPIAQTVKILLDQKTDQLMALTEQATQLAGKLNRSQNQAFRATQPCFGVICDGYRGKKYQNALQETRKSIDLATSWVRFKQLSFRFESQFREALRNGVEMRFVVEKPLNYQMHRWVKAAREKYGNFRIKTQPNPLPAAVAIFDQKKAAVSFSVNASLSKGPDLWTTNPSLAALCKAYFDSVWKQKKSN